MQNSKLRWPRYVAAAAAIVATPLIFGALRRSHTSRNGATVLGQVFQIVTQRAIDSIPEDSVYIKAARGLVNSLDDPYASLYDRKEINDFMRNTIGNSYGGLGMGISQEDSNVVVGDVFPMSPAEHGGVERGDLILAVDSVSTVGWTTDKVSQHLTGPIGTSVLVTFGRAGMNQPITTKFTRAQVHASAVPYTLMLEDHIGYVPLQRFNATAGGELADAVKGLKARGATRFLIDLRDNGGGDVDQAVKVANVFLTRGQEVATQRERNVAPHIYTAVDEPSISISEPVAVLVNGNTASASEIVAGALQDHDRALILGTTTFGKGLVQGVYNLDGGFALKITTGKWYTPSGRSIHRDRKLVDGRLVLSDSGGDTTKAVITHSDDGRRLVARGGITPDVTVSPDTITTPELNFVRASLPHFGALTAAMFDVARTHGHVPPDFTVTPELRATLRERLVQSGLKFDDKTFEGGIPYIDRNFITQALRLSYGDSTAMRRILAGDHTTLRAIELLRSVTTQPQLIKSIGSAN
jgi:carboxyl-terminal processing protease